MKVKLGKTKTNFKIRLLLKAAELGMIFLVEIITKLSDTDLPPITDDCKILVLSKLYASSKSAFPAF